MQFEDGQGFDTVISLETIEHVPDPEGLVRRLAAHLRPGGVLVASVPITPSVDVNPHHLTDFTQRSFRRMFEALGLVGLDSLLQVQPVQVLAVLRRSEKRMSDLRPNLLGWYLKHPGSALRRFAAILRYGFNNQYLTIAWGRSSDERKLRS